MAIGFRFALVTADSEPVDPAGSCAQSRAGAPATCSRSAATDATGSSTCNHRPPPRGCRRHPVCPARVWAAAPAAEGRERARWPARRGEHEPRGARRAQAQDSPGAP
jgi:hypothetical protein